MKCWIKLKIIKILRLLNRKKQLRVIKIYKLFFWKDDDIKEIIKLKQEKPNESNDELLKNIRWLNKKLLLEEFQNKKLKDIREENINTYML